MPKVLTKKRAVAAGAALVVLAGLVTWRIVDNNSLSYTLEESEFASDTEDPATLDTTLYIPDGVDADNPAPAVIVAHGFGGSKSSVEGDAVDLVNRGYVVLTYSARGFGSSTGSIGLNAPDAEVADAENLITMLAERDEVAKDSPDDPKVGIVGASYGGALALLAAGYDDRVDAIVPQITWNRLSRVFFPNGSGEQAEGGPAAPAATEVPGAFKREWAGIFFGFGKGFDASALLGGGGDDDDDTGDAAPEESAEGVANGDGAPPSSPEALVCGRFSAEICKVYSDSAAAGTLDEESQKVLDESSPYSVAGQIKAPTLLIQGQADTLFPISEADVTAKQIEQAGTDVKVMWTSGGHDEGGVAESDDELVKVRTEVADWFGYYLRGEGPEPTMNFDYEQEVGLSTTGGRPTARTQTATSYPGIDGKSVKTTQIDLQGPTQPIVNPAGGVPASISSLPGLGGIASLAYDPPGQAAIFYSGALSEPVEVVGSSTINLTVTHDGQGGTLFAKVYDVSTDSPLPNLPDGAVVPVVIPASEGTTAGTVTTDVEVVLPAIAHRFEVDHRVAVSIATTDRAYASSNEQRIFGVSLVGAGMTIAVVDATSAGAPTSDWIWLIGIVAGIAILATGAGLLWRRRMIAKEVNDVDEGLVDVPLVVSGLHKAYADGFVAVRGVSFEVHRDQVVGLLGPNGAGKTTSLRMLMGLIKPTDGHMRVFGHDIKPGSPVLSRLGCFVEGVGFLPHLSGRENIELYWAATGRPAEDSHLEEVLKIAGLGKAIERKVRTYSQGMRQRLAIAQAMLGLPDLLVLDEPTNGLDPPQIAEMRQVLRSYARDGRSVLVSSHQLAEVEQTCTHVVVMNYGEVIASGTVDEVAGVGSELTIGVDDPTVALGILESIEGLRVIETSANEIGVEIIEFEGAGAVRSADIVSALVAAGVGVDKVMPRRRLEDAFLALVGEAQ